MLPDPPPNLAADYRFVDFMFIFDDLKYDTGIDEETFTFLTHFDYLNIVCLDVSTLTAYSNCILDQHQCCKIHNAGKMPLPTRL